MPFFFPVMLLVFALTLFASALLLFLVQPMVGKMTLPLLGGTPAVWNTCMVFFQAALLAGYAYAHATTTWLGVRRQALLHLILMLLPLLVLPIAIDESWALEGDANPVLRVLGLLTVAVGLPFFVVSASAPVLQKWFASTNHPAARDPYFLYAASNLGSMLALLFYPLLLEPSLLLRNQSKLWLAGYLLLVGLTAACAWLMWRSPAAPATSSRRRSAPAAAPPQAEEGVSALRRLRWVALAFVPSSLMLGTTTYITTDIAAIPLLWVLPLALYLLSFILVFGRLPALVHQIMILIMPVGILLLIFLQLSETRPSFYVTWVAILFNLGVLFVISMVCHGELALSRPSTHYLTEFYLWMSLGGVLGGAFNALAAPLLFSTVEEYRLALVLGAMLMPSLRVVEPRYPWATRILDLALPLTLGVFTLEMLHDFRYLGRVTGLSFTEVCAWLAGRIDAVAAWLATWNGRFESIFGGFNLEPGSLQSILTYGLPLVLAYVLVERPLRFGLAVGAVVLASFYTAATEEGVLLRDRSFFGVLKVTEYNDGRTRLVHGTTLHGMQWRTNSPFMVAAYLAPVAAHPAPLHLGGLTSYGLWAEIRREPLTYYHPTGPIGQVFREVPRPEAGRSVALIGLGTGSLASYGEPGDRLTYYEIDAHVQRIALDPRYFTYVQDALDRGVDLKVVLGDARLMLKKAQDHEYDLVAVDAFSSDAIPMHLITREALQLYLRKLNDHGILAFHISNRYLDLEPVLANLAAEGELVAIVRHDRAEDIPGKTSSTWVLLARKLEHFGALVNDIRQGPDDQEKRWQLLEEDPKVGIWTDDFSNILSVYMWGS